VQFLASLLILLSVIAPCIAQAAPLERGVAVTDPYALRELDSGRLGMGRMLEPAGPVDTSLGNDALFALPSMAPVRKAIDDEFDRYIAGHKAANETIGVGTAFDFQMFDRAVLYSKESRFVLAGIVNRMDRAYVAPDSCGEVRLIYRLTRIKPTQAGEDTSPRLPVTLNIVLRARGDQAVDGSGAALTCSELARRWLAAGESQLSGIELATRFDQAGKHRPHRNQPSDCACGEIRGPRFSHRLSLESVSLQRAVTQVRRSADGEPGRSREDFCRRRFEARIQGVVA
jgi:hypothetical protein